MTTQPDRGTESSSIASIRRAVRSREREVAAQKMELESLREENARLAESTRIHELRDTFQDLGYNRKWADLYVVSRPEDEEISYASVAAFAATLTAAAE